MLGFADGGWFGGRLGPWAAALPESAAGSLVRASALLPGLLAAGGGLPTVLVWAGVTAVNGAAGAIEAAGRQARSSATAPARWLPAVAVADTGHAVVRVTGWARPGRQNRWSAPGVVLAWELPGASGPGLLAVEAGQGVYLSGHERPPNPGQILAGPLVLRVPGAAQVPGGFDYRRYLTGRGLRWQGKLLEHRLVTVDDPVARISARTVVPARTGVMEQLGRVLPPRERELATAVLLGARSPTSRTISAPFAGLGLAHLFAVSGLHVGILLGIILLPGRWLGLSPRAATHVLWLFVPLYLMLTGLPGSVVRAGGMGLLAAQARPLGRRVDALRALGLLYWLGSIWAPIRNLDTGLQLSYLAAGGILLISRVTGGLRFARRPAAQLILGGLAVSFAAQWFTLPVVAASFGRISLLSPLANLIAVPLFGLAVWAVVLALVVGWFWLPLGQWLGAWGWLLLRGIAGAVTLVADGSGRLSRSLVVPGPGAVAGWLLLSGTLIALLQAQKNTRYKWLVGLGAWLVLPAVLGQVFAPAGLNRRGRTAPVEVWQFAVDQGDCGLVVFPDGWSALIDTGGRFGRAAGPADGPLGRSVLPFLGRLGRTRLDVVVLTHGHRDHTGGALLLVDKLPVGRWLVAGRAGRALGDAVDSLAVLRPTAGEVLHRWQDWTLRVAYPLAGQAGAPSENNWSLVTTLQRGVDLKMVWSGDLELAGEARLLASRPDLATAEVWKAGHHGSDTSGSPAWLDLLGPRLILISCGVGNSYGHPSHGPYVVHGDTVPVLRTDLDGSIRLRWGPAGDVKWWTAMGTGR